MKKEILPGSVETRHEIPPDPSDDSSGRNFFVLIDGTWNEERSRDGDGALSNVRKLYDCLADDSPRQVAFYFRGVGNRQDNNGFTKRWRAFNGSDEPRIRRAAYATINKEYRVGDRIFIIGFSRGAACARRLAADLHKCGLHRVIHIRTSYSTNRITRQVESRITGFRGEGGKIPVSVSFLGCWDTVGAFVLPLRYPNIPLLDRMIRSWVNLRQRLGGVIPFQDLKVSPAVREAVHCVAIDETRDAFLPTLMAPDERIEEVWFPGVHADVGGGYHRDRLARITLAFMIERLNRHVLSSGLQAIEWSRDKIQETSHVDTESEYHFHFHGLSRGPFSKSIRCIRVRLADETSSDIKPRIHWSVADIRQSSQVFAEGGNGRRWKIEYMPFNITALHQDFPKTIARDEDDCPFTWIDRPPTPDHPPQEEPAPGVTPLDGEPNAPAPN